ncbi:hypothetical protein GSI_04432 [Ganoderma sinense ZZ0214-1]|uniref:Uncharacterized protein n=1 Tax=Ganoderma sinense ZZ0214-1 TaxID=1077348 RepID=A0A2G8SJB6_9APHY|nr:hypothetical protein GSI_04432 [Ganoderma sinense ZZ0214-1]
MLQVVDSSRVTQIQLCSGLESICEHLGRIPRSLKRIGCDFCSGVARTDQDGTRSLARYLKPLLAFSLIEHCHLIFHHTPPSVCDTDLALLGDVWKKLQSLELRHTRHILHGWAHPTDVQRPTLFGLIELARRCPGLIRVHLPELDARTLPKTSRVSRLGHSVREVSFNHVHYASTHAERPCAVAAVLDTVFPALDVANSMFACVSTSASAHLDFRRPGVKEAHSEWWQVMKIVRAMQLGRRHRDLADCGATFGSDFSASTTGVQNLDWELNLDMHSDYWEPEVDSHEGLCVSTEWEEDSDFDSPHDLVATTIFGHSESDFSSTDSESST